MRYLTPKQFAKIIEHGELTQLTEGNDEIIEQVNTEAVAEIDGYLRGVYALPLTEPPDVIITSITASLMKFMLYRRRDERTIPDKVIEMYKITIAKLKDLRQRKITIDAQGVKQGESVAQSSIASWSPDAKFSNHFTKLFT
ncbi:MAG: DUF1320 domain-containing protein [Rikenellaceae bacterium]